MNDLNKFKLFYDLRELGRGEDKQHWVIEMNDTRMLYLPTYSGIDIMDPLINNTGFFTEHGRTDMPQSTKPTSP